MRQYTATTKHKDGRVHTITFNANGMLLAWENARHCVRGTDHMLLDVKTTRNPLPNDQLGEFIPCR